MVTPFHCGAPATAFAIALKCEGKASGGLECQLEQKRVTFGKKEKQAIRPVKVVLNDPHFP